MKVATGKTLMNLFKQAGKDFAVVLQIAQMVRAAGGRAFLVGGCVRDALLTLPAKDFDLEIYGMHQEQLCTLLEKSFKISKVGMSFGVLKVHGCEIDISLPRIENKTGAGHRGFLVETDPNLSFQEATARRDFTVNAIMLDPLEEQLVDPWKGGDDLQKGILRHISPHFSEDPLRVLRAMQFSARFGFDVADETVELCKSLNQNELAKERIAGEWEKMLLKGTHLAKGLTFLRHCGWVRFYPELKALIGCEQNPQWHPEGDVWTHSLLALNAVPGLRSGTPWDDLVLALAVLAHDFGKPATSRLEDGKIVSKGHPEVGAPLAVQFVNRIWSQDDLAEQVGLLVKNHMLPVFMAKNEVGDRAYRRLALNVKRMDLLYKVSMCDILGIPRLGADTACLKPFIQRVEHLAILDAVPKPLVQGRHLLALGILPGPNMGSILKHCFEAQLDGQFATVEEGVAWLQTQNLL